MTVQELTMVINRMTSDERLILGEYANILIEKRGKQKVHTKNELLKRVQESNRALVEGKKYKKAKEFLVEIREKYAI